MNTTDTKRPWRSVELQILKEHKLNGGSVDRLQSVLRGRSPQEISEGLLLVSETESTPEKTDKSDEPQKPEPAVVLKHALQARFIGAATEMGCLAKSIEAATSKMADLAEVLAEERLDVEVESYLQSCPELHGLSSKSVAALASRLCSSFVMIPKYPPDWKCPDANEPEQGES
jgi:hypothetical protein